MKITQQDIMTKREKDGLKIIVTRIADGTQAILYPKDHSTKNRWMAAYREQGFAVTE